MARKQVGAIDAELLAAVDERAKYLGQTRRMFIERTLQKRLANPDMTIDGKVVGDGEIVYVDPTKPRQSAPERWSEEHATASEAAAAGDPAAIEAIEYSRQPVPKQFRQSVPVLRAVSLQPGRAGCGGR